MRVSKEYKLGLLLFIGIMLFFVGINFLKSGISFAGSNEYYAVFDDATGLEPGSQVQLNGVQIGEVADVQLHPEKPYLIITRFTIENTDLKIPKSSEAWLISVDLIGTKCIDIRMDVSDTASSLLLADGDTMRSKKELTLAEEIKAQLDPLKIKTQKLVGRIEDMIVEVKDMWNKSASYTFEESLYEAREAIDTYKQLVQNLTNIINRETRMVTNIVGNVNTVKDSVLINAQAFQSVSRNVTAIKGNFNTSGLLIEMADLNVNMEELNLLIEKINNGQGTYGALTKTKELQNAVKETKVAMDLLLADMAADPKKYIGVSLLGKKVQGLQLTAEEEKILKEWLNR